MISQIWHLWRKNKYANFLSAWHYTISKSIKVPLKPFIFKQKSTTFCIPQLETPQPILQYCYAILKNNQINYSFHFRYEKKQEESSLHVSHTVRNFEFFYEPFYISLDTAPPFDERFIGYGFTRNTQVGKILTLHIVLTKTLFRKSKTMKKKVL